MFTSENTDSFVTIALGLLVVLLGFRKKKKPSPPRPGQLAKPSGEEARLIMGVGFGLVMFGVARMVLC